MNTDTKVYVIKVGDRQNYYLEWEDPITQKRRRKVTDIPVTASRKDRKAAERLAAELEIQIQNGSGVVLSKYKWSDFRRRYEEEIVSGFADETAGKVQVVFDRIEGILNPKRLLDLTESRLSHFVAVIRKQELAESTIKGYLGTLKSALNWAVSQRIFSACPNFPRIKRAKGCSGTPMKGQAITTEEFERMLSATAGVVGDACADEWKFYLKGLWLSGMRLQESLDLWWDQQGKIQPLFPKDGQPLFQIPGELEKGHTDRLLPMAPEFAMLLETVPASDRIGPVFSCRGKRGRRLGSNQVSKNISKIGKAAGVKVHVHPISKKEKYASAHDLRRAFGGRWSIKVMPAVLKELMRHESIDTTMRFYVGTNAQRTNDAIWAAYQQEQDRLICDSSDFSSDMPPSGRQKPTPSNDDSALKKKASSSSRPGRTRTADQGIMSPLL